MEVMSSLLLCALVALLPQGLGKHTIRSSSYKDVKFNNSLLIQQKPSSVHQLLLNMNAPPLVLKVSELQSVFNDIVCNRCIDCMERAIRAHKIHSKRLSVHYNLDEMQDEVLTNTINTHKVKRDVNATNKIEVEFKREKKSRAKKTKLHKAVTVTKYNIDGAVYALKVKETNTSLLHDNRPSTKASATTCSVYSIKKAFPCDSPEGDLMLKLARRKSTKKVRKDKEKHLETSTGGKTNQQVEQTSVAYRKREVDDTQVPENVMSSVEEFY